MAKGTDSENIEQEAKKAFFVRAKEWGESSVPPTLLATLIFPQHARPLQPLPMLFPPVLLLSSYLNINGYKTDAAGISAAWSGLYMLLASRRKHRVLQKFGARGLLRGATFALAATNLVGGGVAYTFGNRAKEQREMERDRDG